jgi:hypothetical protein
MNRLNARKRRQRKRKRQRKTCAQARSEIADSKHAIAFSGERPSVRASGRMTYSIAVLMYGR